MTDAATRARDAEELAAKIELLLSDEDGAELIRVLAQDAAHLDVLAQVARGMVTDMAALRESVRLADAYIAASPCDPDIYPDQWAAWQAYDADKRARHSAMAAANARALADAFPVPDVTTDAGVGDA